MEPLIVGDIRYQLLTQEYLEEASEAIKESIFMHGTIGKLLGVPSDPQALDELKLLAQKCAEDGMSVIAVHIDTNRVAGVCINKLRLRTATKSFYEQYADTCSSWRVKQYMSFKVAVDAACDLFALAAVDVIMDHIFLGTLAAYRQRGIALRLNRYSYEAARRVARGDNVKQAVGGARPSLAPQPALAAAIYTSFISQRIGRELQYDVVHKGKFADVMRIDSEAARAEIERATPFYTVEIKRLTD